MTPQQLTLLLHAPSTRRVFSAVALGARTSGEILQASGLPVAEAAPAIGRLTRSGLLRSDGPGQLEIDGELLDRAARTAGEEQAAAERAAEEQAARDQPDPRLRGYLRHHDLLALPEDAATALPVLAEIASTTFSPDTDYPEKSVNELLLTWCRNGPVDVVSLRRALVDADLLGRGDGRYRYRPSPEPAA